MQSVYSAAQTDRAKKKKKNTSKERENLNYLMVTVFVERPTKRMSVAKEEK